MFLIIINDVVIRWWESSKCEAFKDTSTTTKELELRNVAGVFVVLAAGATLAFLIALMEFFYRFSQIKTKVNKQSYYRFNPLISKIMIF